MTLRDQFGKVEVGIGDLFTYQGATMGVVHPEDSLYRIIVVRLKEGFIEKDDQRFEATAPDMPISPAGFPIQPCFRFTGNLVANLVREYRLLTFDIPTGEQTPAKTLAKAPRARTSKKRATQQEPTPQSLFD